MTDFRQRKAQERLHEGQAALAREDFAAAEEALDHALRLDPGSQLGWLLWAESLERQGKLIEACRVLSDALNHHPDDPALELAVAHARAEIGQFAAAEAGLLELRRRWPREREPLAHLARVYRDTRKWTRLVELLESALAGEFADDAEFAGLLERCRTWRGERSDPPVAPTSMRELVLSEYGAVLLGTGHDDAVSVPWYSTYLCSERDVLVTCARLLGHAEQFGWRWRSVIAIDPAAEVLAELLAGALELSRISSDVDPDFDPDFDPGQALAVASFLAPGWQARAPAWAGACAERGNLFAFGVLHHHRHDAPLPALIGLAGGERICLPWQRLGEARIGFSRFGLIAGLPDEIDDREPALIAAGMIERLRELRFALGPGFAVQLRHVHEQRAHVHPGLRRRSDFARILPHVRPEPALALDLLVALEHASVTELELALGDHERAPESIGPREIEALVKRFTTTPELRSRMADLLYRVAPARLTALLEGMAGDLELAIRERDGLLHLYGCNPWNRAAPRVLDRWLSAGSVSNRCEIVQSKYALHLLAEQPRDEFAAVLDRLLADEPAIAIGTLRWLHDNPHVHREHVDRIARSIEHPHADVVFDALQVLRIAGHPIADARLERLLEPGQHPRLRSAAVEMLELLPIADTHPRLDALLREREGSQCWAATRSLLRGGATLDDRLAGARIVAARLVELAEDGQTTEGPIRWILQALTSAESIELVLAIFEPGSPALTKIAAAALSGTLLGFEDPRLIELLRREVDAFGLDPPLGLARYLFDFGEPGLDLALVHAAEGAVDPWAGYEAKAVLARWGEREAADEIRRALDHASPFGEAALEAWMTIGEADEFVRLDRARDAGGKSAASAWTIVRDRALRGEIEARVTLAQHLERDPRWLAFIEARLRDQVPGKFVVGAQTAEFGVLSALMPRAFDRLVERTLAGTPDRFALDLLEWLGQHWPSLARTWATRHADSGHFGMRQCARRLLR
ncbi:tetratricopeptide repeat protein [Nannocystaceae bacterium ST9]